MKPKITVCLTTCDREEYTAKTVATFAEHNDKSRFVLLHADDASAGYANRAIVSDAGFTTVHAPAKRQGQFAAMRALVDAVDTEWLLWQENDWEWVAPVPWAAFRKRFDCLRLYGTHKARSGPRALAGTHIMGTGERIDWQPAGAGYERAIAHWGGAGTITRTALVKEAMKTAKRHKDVAYQLHLDTLRVTENVTWHFGEVSTPEWRD